MKTNNKSPILESMEIAKRSLKILLRKGGSQDLNPPLEEIKKVSKKGYMYLATVYSKHPKGIHTAFEDAARAAAWFIERDVCVFCPISHTHPIAIHGEIDPKNHDIWIPMDKPFMQLAKGLIVCKMPNWEESVGINIEINEFKKANKPIFYVNWPLPE